jgi:hypothetical protein
MPQDKQAEEEETKEDDRPQEKGAASGLGSCGVASGIA